MNCFESAYDLALLSIEDSKQCREENKASKIQIINQIINCTPYRGPVRGFTPVPHCQICTFLHIFVNSRSGGERSRANQNVKPT
jgi:hypothetical protein